MSQSQQYAAPRRQNTTGSTSSYGSAPPSASASASTAAQLPAGDELHMSGVSSQQHQQHQQHMSSQDFAPHITLDQPPPSSSAHSHPYPPTSSVPNILQPGLSASSRPPVVSVNTAPTLPTQQDPPSKPSLNMAHSYSRSSPAAGYDNPGYHPYTPTTPGGGAGASSSQFMSPSDIPKYGVPPTGRNVSNTPLGLADIRPRADSSMSEGGAPGTLGYDLANIQPGTSNHMAPWPMYAFDWCKWRPQGNGAGKLAVGSYLEDGHNFVSSTSPSIACLLAH
jgi:DDB1- and CUL4-associated factor 7